MMRRQFLITLMGFSGLTIIIIIFSLLSITNFVQLQALAQVQRIMPSTSPTPSPPLPPSAPPQQLAMSASNNNNNFLTYENLMSGFTMQYPSDWQKVEEQQQGGAINNGNATNVVSFLSPLKDSGLRVTITNLKEKPNDSFSFLNSFANSTIDQLSRQLAGFQLLKKPVFLTGSNSSYEAVYRYNPSSSSTALMSQGLQFAPQDKTLVFGMTHFTSKNDDNRLYMIEAYSDATNNTTTATQGQTVYSNNLIAPQKMVNSFKIVSETPPAIASMQQQLTSPSNNIATPPPSSISQLQPPVAASPFPPQIQQRQQQQPLPPTPSPLPSPSPLNQTTPQQEEEQQPPSSAIPGIIMPPPSSSSSSQQPSSSQPLQPESIQPPVVAPVEQLTADGTIDSLIFAPGTRWIATGNWTLVLRNGSVNSFNTNMTWYNNNGTGTHTHEILNFKPTSADKITVKPGNEVALKGLVDVGTNHRITWNNVHSTIDIKGGKTISISVDDKETNKHFAGQTIYGIVKSFARCSDEPGENMEVPEPCSNS